MHDQGITINSKPLDVARLPFSSEMALQRFVAENATRLLGIDVVGVAERGGGMVSKVDVLCADRAGRLWLIECKHDVVSARAVKQLHRYRAWILAHWPDVLKALAGRSSRRLRKRPDLRLMTIGYRYGPDFPDADVVGVAYRYHGIAIASGRLQEPRPGQVSLHRKQDLLMPVDRHPKVSKRISTDTRLASLDTPLEASFWEIDRALKKLPGVAVTYGGKNLVRYRASTSGVFVVAAIGPDAVEWRCVRGQVVALRSPSDVAVVMNAALAAYRRQVNLALEPTARGTDARRAAAQRER